MELSQAQTPSISSPQGNTLDDFSEEEEEVSEARYRQSHRSRQPAVETPRESENDCLSSKIARDRPEKISHKEKKATESDAQKSTHFVHNVATINTCLADRIGPSAKPKAPKQALGLSYNPSDSDATTEQLSVSPFFTKRPGLGTLRAPGRR